ncbi:MAG: glycosyltransferase family 2 protein [Planctomycetes bacterium]|nr:glycosyltransferase family 2 protein [Planctomycetota bacterium]
MSKLTVIVPCYNNEAILRDCLASVQPFADEIFVVDSGSIDRTREIAREFTDRVVEHEYVNSATQKNWAIPQATHAWVMIIDTDERATPELQREIKSLLSAPSEPEQDGYYIHRQNHFFGVPIKHCGWERDDCLRLFKRDLSRYEDKHVHADVLVSSGKVGHLESKLLHFTYESFAQYLEKFGRYTTWSAKDLLAAGKRPTACNLCLRPAFRFFKMYILRQGFRDGIPGLILCILAAFSVFMKYAKLWGMLRQNQPG